MKVTDLNSMITASLIMLNTTVNLCHVTSSGLESMSHAWNITLESWKLIVALIISYGRCVSTVAYLGFHFGGGVQNITGKVGVFAWREAPYAARGEATRLLGGFGGMLPRENF